MSVYMHANKQSWQLYCSEVASPPLPAQQPARAQLLRKAQEALGFEIKELVLVVAVINVTGSTRISSGVCESRGAALGLREACPNSSTACTLLGLPQDTRAGGQHGDMPHPSTLHSSPLPGVHPHITKPMDFGARGARCEPA